MKVHASSTGTSKYLPVIYKQGNKSLYIYPLLNMRPQSKTNKE
jgi:hypothetical protein